MTVYVDDMRVPYKNGPRTYIMSHMFADTIAEIHDMAERIGVRRSYFQQPPKASWPHYDIAESKRQQALGLGAVLVPYGKQILVPADRLRVEWCLRNGRAGVLTEEFFENCLKRHGDVTLRKHALDIAKSLSIRLDISGVSE